MNKRFLVEIKLKGSIVKESFKLSYLFSVTEVSSIFPLIVCYLSLLPGLLSCACTLKIKKLLVSSPLLIILVGREGSHWYWLPFLSFGIMAHLIQWEWGNVGVTYKQIRCLGNSHSFLLTGTGKISVPPPL